MLNAQCSILNTQCSMLNAQYSMLDAYFGAVRYKYIPIITNNAFGSHTAVNADMAPLTEKEVDMVENKIYNELKASPIPK